MSQPFCINMELYSEELKSTEIVSFSFPALPATFDEIKDFVENSFSIPSCSQALWIQGSKVYESQNCTPSSLYVQSGDTIKITFPVKCECDKVKEVITWLTDSISTIQNIKNLKTEQEVEALFGEQKSLLTDADLMTSLTEHLFTPWSDKVKLMNANYFDNLGGLLLLVKIHEEVKSLRNSNLFKSLHQFSERQESSYCSAFAMFAVNASLRRRVTQCGGLEKCFETFLMVKADESRAVHVIEASLHALCK